MSKLAQLQGKSKTYTIGEVELELKPLKLDDMNFFTMDKDASAKEQTETSLKLMDKVLKDAVPDSTPEERSNIGMQHMQELMDAIMDINGLKDQKGTALDAIKAKQAQAQASRRPK